jgi:hypothetical protein
VVAQNTNLDCVADFQMVPIFPMEFLLFKQNLSRATTEDHTGMGLVKGNSTCAMTTYPQEFPKMDFLILSILFLLPRWSRITKSMPGDLYQALRGASGILIYPLWAGSRCQDCPLMIPEEPIPRGPLHL